MSALALAVRVIWWWSFLTEVLRSISLLKKMRPAGMTLAAKDSLPIRDKSSLFVVFFLVVLHCRNSDVSASNLSWGRRSSIFPVSRRMPRNAVVIRVRYLSISKALAGFVATITPANRFQSSNQLAKPVTVFLGCLKDCLEKSCLFFVIVNLSNDTYSPFTILAAYTFGEREETRHR